jgi:DNA-binding beta-propeller fold protein YncE
MAIHIDPKGFVWITANGEQGGQVLKFTKDGKFVLQIGHPGPQTNSTDTSRLGQPANVMVDEAAHEIYVADGYFNHRVIVFDSETGAFKRMGARTASRRPTTRWPPTIRQRRRRRNSAIRFTA